MDTSFLSSLNRHQKRERANSLRGVQKCLKCDNFGACYNEQQRVLEIMNNHKGNGLLPKNARILPTEICIHHEECGEKGKFYPKYDE